MCYLTKKHKEGSNCGSGYYIIVGNGQRGVITLIPATDAPTMLHKVDISISDTQMLSQLEPLESYELKNHAGRIRETIERNYKGSVYHAVGLYAANQLENCARYVSRQSYQNKLETDPRLDPKSSKYDPLSVIKQSFKKSKNSK